ncbi:MAG: hypothetical protein ACHQQ3_14590 [Gemmatimonadales bacterium]
MPGVRRSLSPLEHSVRLKFDAAPRDGADGTRERLWEELKDARGKGARRMKRLFVRVRLQESPTRIASCLIADLRFTARTRASPPGAHAVRLDAYVSCELLFDSDVPPCERPGPCPHDVVVYVMESDNDKSPLKKRAWDAMRELAAHSKRS